MSDHRSSYLKTGLAAGLAAAGGLVGIAGAIGAAWFGNASAPGWPRWAWLVWTFVVIGLALAVVGAGLVAAGGLIARRRDRLEELGLPYPPARPREWWPRGIWRALWPGRGLRPGDLVEVRTLPEILATLDDRGALDALPFMPEMMAYCGRQFRVRRRADKIYDWIQRTGLRRMRDTVLLEGLRCDGQGHGGCQAGCALLWKEGWLRRPGSGGNSTHAGVGLGAADLPRLAESVDGTGAVQYQCQVTALPVASSPLRWRDPRHYARDLLSGNVRLVPWLVGVAIALFNRVQVWRGGVRYPLRLGTDRKTSPDGVLRLETGETVRVKTKRQIAATLNAKFRNRGLWFDGEMLRYCGGEYRVATRVERLIDERSGALIQLSNPCVILEGVTASGEYLGFCAQDESIFWREIWLERVPSPSAVHPGDPQLTG